MNPNNEPPPPTPAAGGVDWLDGLEKRCGNWTDDSGIGYSFDMTVGELRDVITESRSLRQQVAERDGEIGQEQQRHKSVCDSIQGVRHAWFCESQLANGKCNCGMQITELQRQHRVFVALLKQSVRLRNKHASRHTHWTDAEIQARLQKGATEP